MAARKKTAGKSARDGASDGFTAEEREAMRDRARELKRASKKGSDADEETDVLEKIAAMAAPDRAMAERLHAIIKATAPSLVPRLWYGMPAWSRDGKVLCYFQDARKFKTRYSTLGFSDQAALDDGAVWPVVFALKELNPAAEARIVELLTRALG